MAALVALLSPDASARPPGPGIVPSHCRATDGGYRCSVGPFDVERGERLEMMTGVAAPSEAGFITSARPRLVDGDGKPVSHHVVHLHHAVWLNPYEDDMTCESYDGAFPDHERFFAAGKELTAVRLPRRYGYHWDPKISQRYTASAPWWELVVHLDGIEGSSEVYIEVDIGFVPDGDAEAITPVTPVWLDVRNCSSDPVYSVKQGSGWNKVHKERWRFTMPISGRFVFLGGHLHDGGLRVSLHNATSNDDLYSSRAIYRSSDPWSLTGMTTWSAASGLIVSQGDELVLTSAYDSSMTRRDVMGIMLGAFVPDD